MPKQLTLATQADGGFETHRKPTRRDIFLSEMDRVVPWAALCALIEPFYPKPRADGGGRPVVGLERMLRVHFLQQWYALSDPAVEEALYDSAAMRRFVGIDLGRESAPDETTVCKFRHLLEKHGLAERVFKAVSQHLRDQGLKLSQGTIVDATILGASSSTKNRAKARDPQMHQTKKGNQWYFGMKAHIGVDARTGLVHSVTTTAANVADVTQVEALLHGKEKAVFADAGYLGADKRVPAKPGRRWWIAARRSTIKAIEDEPLRGLREALEHAKASIRAAVEHPFRAVKRQFGHVKALSRIGEERRTGGDIVRAGQPMEGTQAPAGHHRIGAPERRIAAVKRGGAMQNERPMAVKKRRRRSSSGRVLHAARPAGTGVGYSDHPKVCTRPR